MARSIVIIWAAALALTAEAALTSTPRTLRPKAALLGAAATSDDCGNSLKSCADCYSVLTCVNLNGVYRPLTTTACSTSLPYCLNGECVATIDSTESCYKKPSTEFTCVGDGYYPSPSNCKKYYLCVDSEAYEYDCTSYSNTVYSQEMAMCVPSSEATCSVVTCNTAKVGTYQTWAQDKSIYFVCTDTNATHAYVAACDSNQQINATTGNCELACLKEGRIADDDDPRSYYECVQTATNTFVGPTFATCPGNSTFSATTQRCVHATGGSSSSSSDDDAGEYPREEIYAPSDSVSETLYKVPTNLLIGSASSAYQVEGGWNASSKSANIWDVWFHSRPTADNGDVACDSYNKWQEDISLLQQMGMQSYRFSLSWTRLLPGGSQADGYDSAGVEYYNNLINGLIAVGITPIVTIFHWDLPQVYQNDGGWLNSAVADRFADFADFAFAQFGDRVKIWVLINEPNIYCGFAYEGTNWPPGIGQTGTGSYDCVHNQILAHAKAWQVYDTNYRAAQNGKLGSAMSQSWCEPASDSDEDKEAAERSLVFGSAWFFDPLATGDYPKVMRDTIDTNSAAEGLTTSRLPTFTEEEKAIIKGCSDFIAVNHYSTSLVRPGTAKLTDSASTSKDKNVTTSTRSSWQSVGGMTPWGLRYLLNWLYDRYGLPVLVAENGLQGSSDEGTNDPKRLSYYSLFMRATMRAANEDGVDVMGYTAWSLMDNLEWTSGYGPKYGLVYVDFDSDERTRTLKTSASLFQEVAQTGQVPYYAPPTTS